MTVNKLPDEETGYQLDPNYSFWSVLVPEATENLIVNPSFEHGTAGFTITSVSVGVISNFQVARGCYALLVQPTGSATATVRQTYYERGAGHYTFSVDIYHEQGEKFTLLLDSYFYTVIANFTGWGRYSVTWNDTAATGVGASRNAAVVADASNTKRFFLDGWQVEKKPYPTSYCDGDLTDDSFGADPYAYGWESSPHQSQSFRSATAYNGGRLVSFWELAQFKTTAIVGLGMPTPNLTLLTLADGQELQTGVTQPGREFSIVGKIYGSSSQEVESRRQALIDALTALTRRCGQLVLRYQPVNTRGKPFGKGLSITAAYQGGLDGNYTNWYQSALDLKFKATQPELREDFGSLGYLLTDNSVDDSFVATWPNTGVLERNPNTGEWSLLPGTGATSGGTVQCAAYLPDGSLVVGGSFTTIAGVSARRLAKYSYKTRSWAELGGGVDDVVTSLSVGKGISAGYLFVGGSFTHNGAGAGTYRRLVQLNIATGVYVESGGGLNGNVKALCVHSGGVLYVGGDFTASGLGDTLHNLGYYSLPDNEWDAMSSATDDIVTTIVEGPDQNIYVGGHFTVINGATSVNRVAEWITATGVWERLGEGFNGAVEVLAFGQDKVLYAGGTFSGSGLSGFTGLGRFVNGAWEGFGASNHVYVYRMAFDKLGNLYVGGSTGPFGEYGSVWSTVYHQWNGSAWVPFVVGSSVTTPTTGQIIVHTDGRLLICTGGSSYPVHTPGHVAFNYTGTAAVRPKLRIIPNGTQGVLYALVNWTTGKKLYFKAFTLNDEVIIEFTPTGVNARSKTIGDIANKIMYEASDITDFKLVPGINHITLLATVGVPDDLVAYFYYENQHSSIDVASKL